NDAPVGKVTISATADDEQALTASNNLTDEDGLGSITYTWYANGVSTDVTGSGYTLAQADVGKVFTVTASYTDAYGTAESVTSARSEERREGKDAPIGSGTDRGPAA